MKLPCSLWLKEHRGSKKIRRFETMSEPSLISFLMLFFKLILLFEKKKRLFLAQFLSSSPLRNFKKKKLLHKPSVKICQHCLVVGTVSWYGKENEAQDRSPSPRADSGNKQPSLDLPPRQSHRSNNSHSLRWE